MKLLVDTSVWSLALQRDQPVKSTEVDYLSRALDSDAEIYTTGLVLQELLQGFTGPKAAEAIVEKFSAFPMVVPDISDHVKAAEIKNLCRRNGVQTGTIDALIAQLSVRYDLELLSADKDFKYISKYVQLKLAI